MIKSFSIALSVLSQLVATTPASANNILEPQTPEPALIKFNLPSKSLEQTLVELGLQSNITVIVPPGLIGEFKSSPIIGSFTLERALEKILQHAPLSYHIQYQPNFTAVFIQASPKMPLSEPIDKKPQLTNSSAILEEVIVTGIRGSLLRSTDIKRDANGIIEVITAEDINKFPDTNLAESLQRVPGVGINRVNGEGSKVTIRGLDENYNIVTLNNRTMPAAAAPVDKEANSRGFDFSSIASEGIGGVTVYKTSSAGIATGGIGATIDIQTIKPVELTENQQFLGLKAVHDTTSQTSQVTPEVSGLLSWTNDQFGLLISGSIQHRDSGVTGAKIDDWRLLPWESSRYDTCSEVDGNPYLNTCSIEINTPKEGALYLEPRLIEYQVGDLSQKRENAHLTFQYQPNDTIKATLDYTLFQNQYAKEVHSQTIDWPNNWTSISFSNDKVPTPTTWLSRSEGKTSIGVVFANTISQKKNKTESFGLNIDLNISNDLNITIDGHHSIASNQSGNPNEGSWNQISVRPTYNDISRTYINFQDELPLIGFIRSGETTLSGIDDDGSFSVQSWNLTKFHGVDSKQVNQVDQLKIHSTLTNDLVSLELGADWRMMDNNSQYSQITSPPFSALNPLSNIPKDLFTPNDFTAGFDGYSTEGGFRGGFAINRQLFAPWLTKAWSQEVAGQAPPLLEKENPYKNSQGSNTTVNERTLAIFGQLLFDFEGWAVPTQIIPGVRYEQTRVEAENIMYQHYTRVAWRISTGNTPRVKDVYPILSEIPKYDTTSNHYSTALPHLDITLSPQDSIKIRTSFNKTISRPLYKQLQEMSGKMASFRRLGTGNYQGLAASGNILLKPITSKNIDLSFEWYNDDLSYIAVGIFHKDIENLVSYRYQDSTFQELRDPTAGPRAQAALAFLLQEDPDSSPSLQEILSQIMLTEHPDSTERFPPILANEDDPLIMFSVNMPSNDQAEKLSGLELSVQNFFGNSGFGLFANYTYVKRDREYDLSKIAHAPPLTTPFAMYGLSDTMNLALLYDHKKFEARIAYNWRDKYLDTIVRTTTSSEFNFTQAYYLVDAIVSYHLNAHASITLEGINITEENIRRHGRTSSVFVSTEQLGARYQLGFRYSF